MGFSNLALAVQDHILEIYSIVNIPTEKISKISKKSMYCEENPLTVSRIKAIIFREIKVIIKMSKVLLGRSPGAAISKISNAHLLIF